VTTTTVYTASLSCRHYVTIRDREIPARTLDGLRQAYYFNTMILSYRDKRTEAFSRGEFVRAFQGFAQQAYKRLTILDAAADLGDLRALSSNHFEALKDDRAGQYSIRIHDGAWRVCFEWPKGDVGPSNVEIVDYH
jgi:toxin HigB-1